MARGGCCADAAPGSRLAGGAAGEGLLPGDHPLSGPIGGEKLEGGVIQTDQRAGPPRPSAPSDIPREPAADIERRPSWWSRRVSLAPRPGLAARDQGVG